jgi:starch phosphorylase
MVTTMRQRVRAQYLRYGEGTRRLEEALSLLNPNALTLGFARRFATYKRATLIFKDEARLLRLLNNPDRPVQIVFSGKAHPADEPGKSFIQQIYQISQRPEFLGKIIFVENYDMHIARQLIAGVDVWLNNPRRPHEASGTSGQKAALCGIPNFSVLDGWWVEGFEQNNGWAIGEEREYKDEATQDEADVLNLYATLEDEIIPLFYSRNADGVPTGWVQTMKNAIRTCAPAFSMKRMVKEYATCYYLPAAANQARFTGNQYALAREIAAWKSRLAQQWQPLYLQAELQSVNQITVGDKVRVNARVWLNGVPETQVTVELLSGAVNGQGHLAAPHVTPMQRTGQDNGALLYQAEVTPGDSGVIHFGVRARPHHQGLIHPNETGVSRWA